MNINELKDKFIALVDSQLSGDISCIDAKELGEVADMAKDMAEIIELCAEAEYYTKITDAMDKNSQEDNVEYIKKYGSYRDRMYYTEPWHSDMDGKSYMSRRGYMEAKHNGMDSPVLINDIKKWASDVAEDVMEMLKDASAEEKSVLKQHFAQLASKIV